MFRRFKAGGSRKVPIRALVRFVILMQMKFGLLMGLAMMTHRVVPSERPKGGTVAI